MLQANPTLTPNLVKALLQYTAQQYPGYNALRQGAGFLNTLGAVRLAKFYANNVVGSKMPVQKVWSKQIIWGNHRLSGGYINPLANAWATDIIWGTARALDGDNVIWGTEDADNIIWGSDCGGADCDNVIWGTSDDDNIIWGTSGDDNIIWGTAGDNVDNIIWGTSSDLDNIIWGTADALTSWSSTNLIPVPLWDYYYGLYSHYLTSYTDHQFFAIIDAFTSFLNPWVVPRSKLGSQ
jgi:hypothetical protein